MKVLKRIAVLLYTTPIATPVHKIRPPMGTVFQPALQADVSRAGAACDPGALTCTIFDPAIFALFLKARESKVWLIF